MSEKPHTIRGTFSGSRGSLLSLAWVSMVGPRLGSSHSSRFVEQGGEHCQTGLSFTHSLCETGGTEYTKCCEQCPLATDTWPLATPRSEDLAMSSNSPEPLTSLGVGLDFFYTLLHGKEGQCLPVAEMVGWCLPWLNAMTVSLSDMSIIFS